MRAVFRVDASIEIGSGHVIRCLTLAERLGREGWEIHFICRNLPGCMAGFIEEKGYRVHLLSRPSCEMADGSLPESPVHAGWLGLPWEQDAADTARALDRIDSPLNWLLVDHYAIDAGWESRMRSRADRIMVIDDLADRSHDCEVLLDQNLYQDPVRRYQERVASDCRLLLGPQYALLREEFVETRRHLGERDGTVRRVLVFFGGADQGNMTGMTLDAIEDLQNLAIHVDMVVGSGNPHREALEERCKSMKNVTCHIQINNMAEFMSNADLAIGAAGTSTWERCSLSLPALVVSIARNQQPIAEAVAAAGAVTYLGKAENINSDSIGRALLEACQHPELLQNQGRISAGLVDGAGTERVIRTIAEH